MDIENHETQAKILLQAIWRSPDYVHQLTSIDRQKSLAINLPVDNIALAVRNAMAIRYAGNDAYVALAEFQVANNRKAVNAVGAYNFWADIDCGDDKAHTGKGYRDNTEALTALAEFCKAADLPLPSIVVDSGGGLHVYWVLDDFLERRAWQAYAKKLKAVMKAVGFLADPTRTADIASILRVPGTLNHKYQPPRPVQLIDASQSYIDAKSMCAAIEEAHAKFCPPAAPKPTQPQLTAPRAAGPVSKFSGPHNLERLASALAYIDPDCDESTWSMQVIGALAQSAIDYPELHDDLYLLAKLWSSGELVSIPAKAWTTPGNNGRCGAEVFDEKWQRLINSRYMGTPTRLGTIFFLAKQAGWIDPLRRIPDDDFVVIDNHCDGGAA